MRKALRGLVHRGRENPETLPLPSESRAPTPVTANEHRDGATESPPVSLTGDAGETANDQVSEDLWTRAYQLLSSREPVLVADYEHHLQIRQDDQTESPSDQAQQTRLSNPASVKELVSALQEERETKQWKFSVRNKDHKIRDQLQKLVKLLTLADGVVKQAASAQPYAALAWSAASIFLPLLSGGFSLDTAMIQGFTTIGDLQLYWKNCEDVYLNSTSSQHYQNLKEPISNVYSFMLEYQLRAICHLSRKQFSRAWKKIAGSDDWAGKEAYIIKISEMCKAHVSPLQNKEIQHNVEVQWQKLDGIATTMEEHRQQDKAESFLQALKEAAQNYLGGKDFNPDPVDGTCEWFYNDANFSSWRDSAGSGVFWITAGPGCGKSVLTRALINRGHLENGLSTIEIGSETTFTNSETTLCYFFFKDESVQRSSMNSALCAILHQLFLVKPTAGLIKHALPHFNSSGKVLTESFDDLWGILLRCTQNQTGGDVICVLDALDECQASDRKQFLNKLDRLYADNKLSSASGLKFLITSRPYDDIEASFLPISRQVQYFRFDADERHREISHDIELVIDAKMDSFASGFEKQDRQRIAESLKSRGTNTYLWLRLILDIIRDRPSKHSRPRDVEKLLADIPSQVSDAYEKILSRTEDEETTIALLQILLAAARPLTLEEANLALTLATTSDDIETHNDLQAQCWSGDFKSTVKNLCGLIIDEYEGKLSFIHLTARDFFIKDPGQKAPASKWRGRFSDPASLHSVLSSCCMRYLLLDGFASRNLPALYIAEAAEAEYRFLTYAAQNWPHHLRLQGKAYSSDSLHKARTLCNVSQLYANTWGSIYLPPNITRRGKITVETFVGWTDLAVASFLGLDSLVEHMLTDENANINEISAGYGSALHAAVAGCQESTTSLLISRNAHVNMNSGYSIIPLDLAVALRRHGKIARLLAESGSSVFIESELSCNGQLHLERKIRGNSRRSSPVITVIGLVALLDWKDTFYFMLAKLVDISTPEAIIAASTNQVIVESGDECMAMLLNLLDDQKLQDSGILTEAAVRALTCLPWVGERTVRLLVQTKQQHMLFQEATVRQVSMITNIHDIFQEFLLQQVAPFAAITPEVLEAVAGYYDAATLKLFIEYSQGYMTSMDQLLKAACNNERHHISIFDAIFDLPGASMIADESLHQMLLHSSSSPTTVELCLKIWPLSISIGQSLIDIMIDLYENKTASEGARNKLFKRLLDHLRGQDVVAGELIIMRALQYCDVEAIKLLLQYSNQKTFMQETSLTAATQNKDHWRNILEYLLREYNSGSTIPSNVLIAGVTNNIDVLRFLFAEYSEQIAITAEVLSRVELPAAMTMILERKRNQAEDVAALALYKAVSSIPVRERSIEHLLQCCPASWFDVTEEMVLNLLENSGERADVTIALLIKTLGDKIELTESIIAAAATHRDKGTELLDMLQNWKPASFKITRWVLERVAAGGNLASLDHLVGHASEADLGAKNDWYRLVEYRALMFDFDRDNQKRVEAEWARGFLQDMPDAHGRMALHLAVATGQENMISFLLETAKADLDAVDRRGRTVLHHAVAHQNTLAVNKLLPAQFDPHLTDHNGESPIALAERLLEFETDIYGRNGLRHMRDMLNKGWMARRRGRGELHNGIDEDCGWLGEDSLAKFRLLDEIDGGRV